MKRDDCDNCGEPVTEEFAWYSDNCGRYCEACFMRLDETARLDAHDRIEEASA